MSTVPPAENLDDGGITVSIIHHVREGQEREFEDWLAGATAAAAKFPGFVDLRSSRLGRGESGYRVVVRFDRESDLRRWEESDERRQWFDLREAWAEDAPRSANITGTAQERRLTSVLSPLEGFAQTSVSGIGLLLLGTVVAVVLANSPLSEAYERFWQTEFTVGTEAFGITTTLRHWINDGLMALFFFIVGLEIKRELLVGDLRYPRLAALPIAAALGGAVVPALIYAAVNFGGEGARGWGIPMATDTAFSLGVISLLGSRVSPILLVFLTAFAIVDDIVAVSVIALFYTDTISWPALGVAVALLAGLAAANAAGIHRWPVYAVLGLAVWVAVYKSGVHGTIAGVLVAATVPARSWINPSEFLERARGLIADFEAACYLAPTILSNEPQQRATQALEQLCEEVETPMTHLQHRLNPWVAYGILPLFALANAGIPLLTGLGTALASPTAWGVMLGLVVGKPLGIGLFTWVAVRAGIAYKAAVITWQHITGVALLGGIGFTMSLFITDLAFGNGASADAARVGILLGSLIAGVAGFAVLRSTLPPARSAQ